MKASRSSGNGGQGAAGSSGTSGVGKDADPWASSAAGGYSDEPPF